MPEFTITPRSLYEPDAVPTADAVKLAVPFEMTSRSGALRAKTVAQDSPQEIAQCVYAVLATEPGQRTELPEYGFADQAFRQGGVDLEELQAAVEAEEDRADLLTEAQWEGLTELVKVSVRR